MSPSGPHSLCSVDGEIMLASEAMIPAVDDGFVRGDGAFEVVRVHDGVPFAMDEHLARMERTGAGLRLPIDLEAVRADAHRLLAHAAADSEHAEDHRLLRLIVTRGGHRVLITERLPDAPERLRLLSTTYAPTRVLDGLKSLSYAANMLATRLAKEAGFDDALLVTPHGRVLEAPTRAVFWVSGGELCTVPLSEPILASITRAVVLGVCEVRERSITLEELYAADEVFLASTTREVHPVAAIDDHEYPETAPVTERTAERVMARVRERLLAAASE
ncbi:MAG TPA: aminotransferase class IV [Solirubrobacteraceae bacterium]|nr:aminotransferase class IV [Solirubrobacteraceae bacterium]